MKKRSIRKLSLRRESLRNLSSANAKHVVGGTRVPPTSACTITNGFLCDIEVPPSVNTCNTCDGCRIQ